MPTPKHAAIRNYLTETFPNCEIEQEHDSVRHVRSFRINSPMGMLVLKVSDEFVEDNDVTEIKRLLNLWAVSNFLKNNSEHSVLLSETGTHLQDGADEDAS